MATADRDTVVCMSADCPCADKICAGFDRVRCLCCGHIAPIVSGRMACGICDCVHAPAFVAPGGPPIWFKEHSMRAGAA